MLLPHILPVLHTRGIPIWGLVLSLFLWANVATAQIAIGIKWNGFTAHLKEYPYSKHYRGRLGRRGLMVVTDGIALTVDVYLNQHVFIKVAQSFILHDCGGKFMGMSHLGLGYSQTAGYPHQGNISFGPMLFYRRSWVGLPDYSDPDHFFKVSKNTRWQTKFVWYGGQMEYDYFFRNGQAFSVNWVPAIPELFAFMPGFKLGY